MHKNNFDFLRLLFAVLVIIIHAYPLSGVGESDWVYRATNHQILLSVIGVRGFFIISGFLIFQSLRRSKSILDYYWKRVLRLFPALIVVLLLTVILAPFVYTSPIPYFKNKYVLGYLPNNLTLFRFRDRMDGIFQNNPNPNIINGSLWTIEYEFALYIFLSCLFSFKDKTKMIRVIFLSAFILLYIYQVFFIQNLPNFHVYTLEAFSLIPLSLFFVGGSLLATINVKTFKFKKEVLFVSLIGLIVSVYFNAFNITQFLFLPLAVILFGLQSTKYISGINNSIGDLSYGLYIYSYPIQQTLMHYFKLNTLQLCIYSLILSIIFSYLSWHLIEKKALMLKNFNPLLLFRGDLKL